MNEKETYLDWTRQQKLDYLEETCRETIIKDSTILRELVRYMSEDQFTQFYEYFCNNNCIYKDYAEWDAANEQEENTVVTVRSDNSKFMSDWDL